MKENKKLVFCTGGTGGHVFPAVSLYESLKKNKYQILFLTDKRCEYILKENEINYKILKVSHFNKKKIYWFFSFLTIIRSVITCMRLFIKNRPDLIVGFGGYVSFPGLFSAKILKIPFVIHEQNAVMGKANRVLSNFAKFIALTYKKTKYCTLSEKVIHTGMPIREFFYRNYKKKKLKNKKKILILGGSQGATIFSILLPTLFKELDSKIRKKISICQQVITGDKEKLEKVYGNLKIEHNLKTFFKNINEEIFDADLIISRCGASTLAEIEVFPIPIFLFPLPNSRNDHQYVNAKNFSKNKECIIFNEKHFNKKKFLDSFKDKINSKVSIKKTNKKIKKNQKLKNLIQTLLGSNQ